MQQIISCEEYDKWKESKLGSIVSDYIDDEPYFSSRKDYFTQWETSIREYYQRRRDDEKKTKETEKALKGLELPPYSMAEVQRFEVLNRVYLPIQLKYYITRVSRWIAKYHGAIFQIYTVNDENELYEPVIGQSREILKVDFLSREGWKIPDGIGHLENYVFMTCDHCKKAITKQVTCCDACSQDLCEKCMSTDKGLQHAGHHIKTYDRKPFFPTGRLCGQRTDFKAPEGHDHESDPWRFYNLMYCKKDLDKCKSIYFCWECEKSCCTDCHDRQGQHVCEFGGNYMLYDNPLIASSSKDSESDTYDVEPYLYSYEPGKVTIGLYGCGERDLLITNGPDKGMMYFLIHIGGSHYRVLSSFFPYLCYSYLINF